MNGAIFLFILQGDDGHGKSVSKVISPRETEESWRRIRVDVRSCSPRSFLTVVAADPRGQLRPWRRPPGEPPGSPRRATSGTIRGRGAWVGQVAAAAVAAVAAKKTKLKMRDSWDRNSMSERRQESKLRARCVEGLSFLLAFSHFGCFDSKDSCVQQTDRPNRVCAQRAFTLQDKLLFLPFYPFSSVMIVIQAILCFIQKYFITSLDCKDAAPAPALLLQGRSNAL